MWSIGGELKHFGIMGQKWGVRRYQNADGTLTEAGKERYSGSDAKKNFVQDYKDVNNHHPYRYLYTASGPSTVLQNPGQLHEYVVSQTANANAFRDMHKDFAKKQDKMIADMQGTYKNFLDKKIPADVLETKIYDIIGKHEDYGKKYIKEKYKDVLSMETENFKDMMAINMIWFDKNMKNLDGSYFHDVQRMDNTNLEKLMQIYKDKYGRNDMQKVYSI